MSPRHGVRELVEFADRAGWREWLSSHHADSEGVRLAIGKKGGSATSLTYEEAVEEAVCFGWIDSKTERLDAERYTVVMTPRKRGSIWAASNKERVARLSSAGRMTPAGIAAVERAKADGSWTILDEVDALVVPPDLALSLSETPGAAEGFSELGVSARKQALYWIASAKRPATRERRISETVKAAAEGRSSR